MSLGDEHDYGSDAGRTEGIGGTGQTRTRLPDGGGDVYGNGRRPVRASRSLVTVVGVVVLLIAAIAFANRGNGDGTSTDSSGSKRPGSDSTAASGVKPVTGNNEGIASGFAHSEQGAQSAAANYAVALVSADILKPSRRAGIVTEVFAPDHVDAYKSKLDKAYDKQFLDKVGLDANGEAGKGLTYVSRTAPVGTKVTEQSGDTATVEVWCTGVFGTAGVGSTSPVTNDWFTMTLKLQWVNNDWKVESFAQKDGPAPVNTDSKASTADEIAKAVEQYGGFTYAR
ncbi:hypothetical protein OG709_19440 [Streptomyces sp. NBC_01267]|uniref:hypothetical protein n=1 Tax=unclassified Streptomyces TaxID=2593676 RepID=UPI002E35AEAC|nr:hypothetical protein [Streptomyces sp. NBC_01267]WSV54874.1 hypothetical protein OG282_14800 [Streptomyces sp. NBC_01014]